MNSVLYQRMMVEIRLRAVEYVAANIDFPSPEEVDRIEGLMLVGAMVLTNTMKEELN